MLVAPLGILYGIKVFPGYSELSSSQQTIISGIVAVISVNLVIGFYIYIALKEPSGAPHQPDPKFMAQAKASMNQSVEENVKLSDDALKKEE